MLAHGGAVACLGGKQRSAALQPGSPSLSLTAQKRPKRRTNAARPAQATAIVPVQPNAIETASTPASSWQHASVALVALGCPKNTVDAEVMLGDLQRNGYRIVDDPGSADVVIVNTCAFIEDAKTESIDAILEASQLKGRSAKGLFVTGCLAQRYAGELASELPEVDAVVGFENYSSLPEQIARVLGGDNASTSVMVGTPDVPFRPEAERWRITPKHTAYLRVAEGCDHACTFCSIPGFRGRFRSKSFDAIVGEAERLVASGARELNLIAEDTNQWGMDFGAKDTRRLSHLLHALAGIEKLKWIRLLYCYPSYFTDDLIDAIADINKVCKYIDIPLQHISDPVLKRMQRPSRPHTASLLAKLRERIPGVVLRTTFISGFPGETRKDHADLSQFVEKFGFERGGIFAYSEEDGTPAAQMKNQVPRKLRQSRRSELTGLFRERQEVWAAQQVGQELEVMVDRMEDDVAVCRSQADAPEVDNNVLIPGVIIPFTPGSIMRCKVVDTDDLDLIAEPVL
eukprot:jgi/Chlat1/7666/Chrsp64S07132